MPEKVYVLKIEEPDLSQLFVGSVVGTNSMVAMQTLLDKVKSETNDECDLRNIELLEFPYIEQ